MKNLIGVFILTILLISCKKENTNQQIEKESLESGIRSDNIMFGFKFNMTKKEAKDNLNKISKDFFVDILEDNKFNIVLTTKSKNKYDVQIGNHFNNDKLFKTKFKFKKRNKELSNNDCEKDLLNSYNTSTFTQYNGTGNQKYFWLKGNKKVEFYNKDSLFEFVFTNLEIEHIENEKLTSKERNSLYSIKEKIVVDNFEYEVLKIAFKKKVRGSFNDLSTDNYFLLVALNIKNIDKKQHTIDSSMFKLTDEDNFEFGNSSEGTTFLRMNGEETFFLKSCNPLIKKQGLLIFEVPHNKKYYLHLRGKFWSAKSKVIELTE